MSYVHTGRCVGKLALIYRDNFEVSLPPKSYNRWSQKFHCVETWRWAVETMICEDFTITENAPTKWVTSCGPSFAALDVRLGCGGLLTAGLSSYIGQRTDSASAVPPALPGYWPR